MKLTRFFLLFIILLCLFIVGCGQKSSPANTQQTNVEQKSSNVSEESKQTDADIQSEIVINIGTTTTEDSSFPQAMKKFKEIVEAKTNGDIKVNLHYNSALGGEREMVEAISIGTLEGTMTSTAVITNFVPEMAVLDLPFIFRDKEHARSSMQGEVGQVLAEKMESSNLKLIGWGENGFRHITNSKKPIYKPEDLEGIKIRTMENQVHLEVFRALGANPTPMAWGEVYTSLQQGVIDAQENPIFILWVNNLNEVQDYVSLTGHVYSPGALILDKTLFDSLSLEYQEIIMEAAQLGVEANYAYNDEKEEEYIEDLKSRGMQFNEVEKEPFVNAVQDIIEKYKDVAPDIYEMIVNQ